jgi:hypothetical protein
MNACCRRSSRRSARGCHGLAIAVAAVLAPVFVAGARAQDMQNITYPELKLGVWAHDVHFLGGKEHGADINPEYIFGSPVGDDLLAAAPWWLRFALQPRPTIGAAINTAGDTDQFYLGGTWSWMLVRGLARPDDGIFFSFFFGPGFNDGKIGPAPDDRKALGSYLLFREAAEIGYQINATWSVSTYLDHISNGGLAKYNQSINDVGVRVGVRF